MSSSCIRRSIAALIIAVFLIEPVPARAATGLGVSPGRFDFDADPGQVLERTVTVSNEGDKPISIRSCAMDRRIEAGQVEFVEGKNPAESPSLWISVEPSEFSLLPGKKQEIRWKASVPENAIPGDKAGVLFFETVQDSKSGAVSIGGRVGAVISIGVLGEKVPSGRLSDFRVSPPSSSITLKPFEGGILSPLPVPIIDGKEVQMVASFQNTGNVRLPVKGKAVIRDAFGRTVKTISTKEPLNIFPGDSDDLHLDWDDAPVIGRFVVSGEFIFGDQKATSEIVLYTFPVKKTLSVVFLGIGIWLLARYRKEKKSVKDISRGEVQTFPSNSRIEQDALAKHPPVSNIYGNLPSRKDRKRQKRSSR